MMKKHLIVALATVALLASCTTNRLEQPAKEIVFQAVSHSVSTKAGPADYKDNYQNVPFGTYAWYKGLQEEDNTEFMENQSVSYYESKNTWAPTGTTYYWPKTGTVDFISYSPYTADGKNAPKPMVTENSISFPAWNVEAHQDVDVMYSDKAVGLSGNINTFNHGYEGVPTLFRHALAKIAFQIGNGYSSITSENGDTTRWEVIVNDLTVNNLLTTGTLSLNLGEDGKWAKPEDNAWASDGETGNHKVDISGLSPLSGEVQSGSSFFVLPQVLEDQSVTINVTINTYHDRGDGSGEQLLIKEENVEFTASLKTPELDTWGINQYITYVLTFYPTSDVEPVEILFDPAVVDWEEIVVNSKIVF